jgi:hypothetical protein
MLILYLSMPKIQAAQEFRDISLIQCDRQKTEVINTVMLMLLSSVDVDAPLTICDFVRRYAQQGLDRDLKNYFRNLNNTNLTFHTIISQTNT